MGFAVVGHPTKLAVVPLQGTGVTASSTSRAGIAVAPACWRRCHSRIISAIRCDGSAVPELKTCRNCKAQFDSVLNHPTACRFHTSHFGGETKRKFESVYAGGTMDTPGAGKVFQYWHCCGSEDPFDPGCTAAPHSSYDE